MDLLISDKEFSSFIKNPSIKNVNKLSLLNIISDKLELSKLTKDFIGVVTNKGRVSSIHDIIFSYKELVSDFNGIKNAHVSAAKVLTEEQVASIKEKLKEKFSAEFNLHTHIDKSLIAKNTDKFINERIEGISEELLLLEEYKLISTKPIVYICNVDESSAQNGNQYTKVVEDYAKEKKS